MPENKNECVVEKKFLTENNKQIGDTIRLEVEDAKNDDGEDIKYLIEDSLTIVGTVQSPLYISRDRGTSSLGAGKVNYYIYITNDNINAKDIYTNIYLKLNNSEEYTTSSEKYEDYVEDVKNDIEEIKEEREKARYDTLRKKAEDKVNDAEKELNEQKSDAESEIAKAEKKLNEAKQDIKKAESEIKTNKQKADTEFKNAEKEITKAKEELQKKEEELIAKEKQLNSLPEVSEAIKLELDQAKKEVENAKNEISKNETQLSKTKQTTNDQIKNAEKEVEKAKQELQKGEKELSKNKKEFEEKIADAEEKLKDARDKINDIEMATWYILDRNANAGYVGFIQDTDSIANIGRVFPVVFFIVATLISLTSMTRMVEEQRMQIGTLKALGYNRKQITLKYIIYAGLACIIGGILGMSIGFVILPKVIWLMYGMMYELIDIEIEFNLLFGGLGLILISVCILGATIYTVLKELRHQPSVLMRPKAPKSGNRVMLERIPFIWKRLNFSKKVTVRNLFRYKKRFCMTIIGILGCTSLILAGFGLKDSVKQIIPNQFENVFVYDMQITLKDDIAENEKEELIKELDQEERIEKIAKTYMTSGKVYNGENSEDVQIIIPETEEQLDGIIYINDTKTKNKISMKENEICLTDKAAQLLGINAGDTITLEDSDENKVEVKVSNVVENYVQHYVFMTKETYEKLYETKYETNVILTKNIELSEEEADRLATNIMDKSQVASVSNIASALKTIEDMMSLLNYVVVVLIVSAGLLAFVVLYNLANVNISERIRELATIKVLGFYDKEVYNYVAKETVILTIIGIILGLAFGFFLNYYILETCEINMLRFPKIIHGISYLYAILITVVFTVIVNIVTYFSLKKINMIESLKSVE